MGARVGIAFMGALSGEKKLRAEWGLGKRTG